MDQPSDIWSLPTRHIGKHVHVYDTLDSTNSLALAVGAEGPAEGLAFLVRVQSAGRGQYGRSWLAPPGSSVLLSVLLFPPESLRRPALLTAWAAVSVCELIRTLTGLESRIKWPNDVFLGGRKVCGILIEQRSTQGTPATVMGLGLNVRQEAKVFEDAGLLLGGSLCSQSGLLFESDDVARRLLQQLDDQNDALARGDHARLQDAWRRYLGLEGREVMVELGSGRVCGWLRELSFAGVELETAQGVVCLVPESIKHLHEFGEPGA